MLVTTCIIGATFAKYTTTGSATDTARVAKWGVTITTSGSLYSDAYANKNAANGNLPADWTDSSSADAITVLSGTKANNIVAPGTKSYGDGLSFGITGMPEVAVDVATIITAEDIYLKEGTYGVLVEATVKNAESLQKLMDEHSDKVYFASSSTPVAYTKLVDAATYANETKYYVLTDEATVDTGGYYPVKYKLEGGAATGANLKAMDVAEKLAQVLDTGATSTITDADKVSYQASYTADHDYSANTDLSTAGPKFSDEKLSWEWPIGGAADDPKDTILGNLIAAHGATVDYVVVSVDAGKVTPLTISGASDDYTVKKSGTSDVVANLRTMVSITLTATQKD